MDRPAPQVGLVIRHDFLWSHERARGHAAGAKERPCVVVAAVTRGPSGETHVLLAPVTHATPRPRAAALALPPAVARHLGLDAERGFIVADEANTVSWDDPGLVPAVPGERWAYGRLPKGLYEALRSAMLDLVRNGRLKPADRES